MNDKFNLAICPPKEVVAQVRSLKKELESHIGPYSARNSEAHITFDLFLLDEASLSFCEEQLHDFATTQKPFKLGFHSFSCFKESRTVFLEPVDGSAYLITELFHAYKKATKLPGQLNQITPHMTIGKGIEPEMFEAALVLFNQRKVEIDFICNNLALRRFIPAKGQYEIWKRFHFAPV